MATRGDERQLVGVEHLAGRVVRRVEQDQPGARRHGGAQLVGVEVVATVGAGAQQHRDGAGAGQGDARLVAVVHRLEHDDLVAVVEHAEQGAGERLGGAGGDEHLGVGVVLEAVEALLVAGDRLAQHGQPGPGGYWLTPPRMASTAASSTSGGPSVSGKPWPRLIAPVATASADISAKIVVPKPCAASRSGRGVRRSARRAIP